MSERHSDSPEVDAFTFPDRQETNLEFGRMIPNKGTTVAVGKSIVGSDGTEVVLVKIAGGRHAWS